MGSQDETAKNPHFALSRDECFELLATVDVGRVGGTVNFRPFIFPVNFRVHSEKILIRTVPGTKLDAALSGQVIAFEADSFAHGMSAWWSVLIRGTAEEVTDSDELAKIDAIPVEHFAFREPPPRVLLLSTVGMSGRRYPRPSE